jgi:plastocyanin
MPRLLVLALICLLAIADLGLIVFGVAAGRSPDVAQPQPEHPGGHLAAMRASDDDECDSSGSGSGSCPDEDDEDEDDSGRGRGRGRGRGGDDEDEAAGAAADAATGAPLEVRIVGRSFAPGTLTIEAGQTVTFVNTDDDEHTATGPGFDTGTIAPGGSATVTFDTVGSFDYVCSFHSEMRGTIVVAAAGAATPPASPAASPAATPAGSPAASPAASPATTSEEGIEIVDFAFAQETITVAPGTTVVWTNAGSAPHTVTGDFGDSGTLETGQTFEFTFTEPGTYGYVCAFHPNMVGEIVVSAG